MQTHTQTRIQTPEVQIRNLKMGGANPIVIQSMTNTPTQDAQKTAEQIMQLADAGSEIVRITVNSNLAAPQVPEIRKILNSKGYEDLPIVGDFHFNGHILLTEFPEMAATLDKYRINPGNSGKDENFETFIKIAAENNKPIRIGVNWGSLDQVLLTQMMDANAKLVKPRTDKEVIIDAMVKSAITSAQKAEELGLKQNQIVLSVKMSIVRDCIAAYEQLAAEMQPQPYALHLGLTEAGAGLQGVTSSSAALAILLNQGIGDTIRISLTPTPQTPRTEEVEACKSLLQSLEFRHFKPQVTSCPGCGRTDSTFFQELAEQVNKHLEEKMQQWRTTHPKAAELKVAVMGCVVNGPGESQHAHVAISLPGTMEKPVAPVYINGKHHTTLKNPNIAEQFIEIVEEYVRENF